MSDKIERSRLGALQDDLVAHMRTCEDCRLAQGPEDACPVGHQIAAMARAVIASGQEVIQ